MIFLVSVFQKKEDLNFEVTREEEREKKKREKKKREAPAGKKSIRNLRNRKKKAVKLRSSTYFLQHKLASVEGLDEKTMTVDPENLVEILLENWVRHFFFFFFPLPRLFSRTSAALTFKTAFSLSL